MNENSVSRFKGLLKVMDIIYLIGVVLSGIGTLALVGLTILIISVSEGTLNKFLQADYSKVMMSIGGLNYEFTKSFISEHLEVNKGLLISVLIIGILNAVLFLLIMWYARKLIHKFSKNEVFSNNNGKFIGTIAILFLFAGHTYKLMVSMLSMFIDKSLNLSHYLSEADVIRKVSYNLISLDWNIILIAITIWFIGRAFRYGAYLQNEYDATV
ncbi:DUF2975 domain-containing protein [Macrococcoides goetzii]|nr:DUF2975 domain-containing protein [Macrococcus goetzii]TDM44230.1 DUF2975 domain-containing protein [Macrococcus goetzii]TDM47259.1 DUF2975 domain-containing protein [Macrococcus goetzii]